MYPSSRIPARFVRAFRICFGCRSAALAFCRKRSLCPLPADKQSVPKRLLSTFHSSSARKKTCCALLAAGLGLGGCHNNEPAEVPAPVTPVDRMIVNTLSAGYWRSEEYFIYTEDGEEKVSWGRTLWGLKRDLNESTYACGIDIFSCTPEGSIHKYDSRYIDGRTSILTVLRGAYSLYFNLDGTSVRLVAHHRPFAENSIYNHADLHLRSIEPDRIEFDMDLNAIIRAEWALFIPLQNTTGVRVVFTSISDEAMAEEYINPDSPEELPLIPL